MSAIRENLESIKFNIKESANNAKRSSEDITLIAVTKTVDVDKILEAIEYGVTDVGENKPQELARKGFVDFNVIVRQELLDFL